MSSKTKVSVAGSGASGGIRRPAGGAAVAGANYEVFLSRLAVGGRSNVERHLTACERDSDPAHVRLWKRLNGYLAILTPDAIPTASARAVQFYVADGRYKKQVFAVEDLRDGKVAIYTGDALAAAIEAGILIGPTDDEDRPSSYELASAPDERLEIEVLSAANTTGAPDYYRHMLGWNRQAIRLTLLHDATPAQVDAAEAICALAASRFPVPSAKAVGVGQ